MSKGNLFLGYGRGKIGDIVLTRGEGQQISRARNRSPRNPKTEKQMYQRAVMATVMSMYKAGKDIFDHSFQGKQVALGSMKRFMSVNAKKLRENIVADLANNTVTSSVISPGAVSPVPYSFRISEGTMAQGYVTVQIDEVEPDLPIGQDPGPDDITTYHPYVMLYKNASDYADEVLTPGDIYTIVVVGVAGIYPTFNEAVSPSTIVGWVRLEVKENLPHSQIANCVIADVFDVTVQNCRFNTEQELGVVSIASLLNNEDYGAIGVIRSREDSGLRSTSEMSVYAPIPWGITPANIPAVWNANVAGLGNSELILEGGDM